MIIRDIYLEKLKRLKDKQIIKVITGIRRCGKSTLMKMFQKDLFRVLSQHLVQRLNQIHK